MANSESSLTSSRWSPGHTLAGSLQRGTRHGYLQALAAPLATSRELLLACIREDPRWDRQLDSRGSYYAGLFQTFRLDVDLLVEQLRCLDADPDEASRWLTIEVLGALSRRGVRSATSALRDYIGWGASWSDAVSQLAESGSPGTWVGLDEVICERCPDDDELTREVYDEEPWLTWSRTNVRIAAAVERHRANQKVLHPTRCPEPFAACSVPELFQQVTQENWAAIARAIRPKLTPQELPLLAAQLDPGQPWRCKLALAGLGKLSGPDAFALWRQFVERHTQLPRHLQITFSLASRGFDFPAAQAVGQEWFLSESSWLRNLGERLLAQSATSEALALLREAVAPALAALDLYRLSSIAKGLERIGSAAAWDELVLAFHETPYSYGRYHVAKAMTAVAPDRFAEEVAGDALWDCEPGVRQLACDWVNPSQGGIRRRLRELAADPAEDEDVRGSASRHMASAILSD